jgi:serine/threonine protein kinase
VRLTDKGRVKLCDLSEAWSAHAGHRTTPWGTLKGAPAYFAPEVVSSLLNTPPPGETGPLPPRVDTRSDIFSLGVLLLEMLLGYHPLDKVEQPAATTALQLPPGARTERKSWLR